jgi:hypothetical protein
MLDDVYLARYLNGETTAVSMIDPIYVKFISADQLSPSIFKCHEPQVIIGSREV